MYAVFISRVLHVCCTYVARMLHVCGNTRSMYAACTRHVCSMYAAYMLHTCVDVWAGTVISATGTVAVVFSSDLSVPSTGFVLYWHIRGRHHLPQTPVPGSTAVPTQTPTNATAPPYDTFTALPSGAAAQLICICLYNTSIHRSTDPSIHRSIDPSIHPSARSSVCPPSISTLAGTLTYCCYFIWQESQR